MEVPRFRVVLVVLILFISVLYVWFMGVAWFSEDRKEEDVEYQLDRPLVCPPQPVCETDEIVVEDEPADNDSEIVDGIHICGIVAQRDVKEAMLPEKEVIIEVLGNTYHYHFIHVYARNDLRPKDENRRQLLIDFDKEKTGMKLIEGFKFYKKETHPCNFYFLAEGDSIINFTVFSFLLQKSTPTTWLGHLLHQQSDMDTLFESVTGHKSPDKYMRNPLFVMGEELADCAITEIEETMMSKGWKDIVSAEFTTMGRIVEICQSKGLSADVKMKDVSRMFYGGDGNIHGLNSINTPNWEGYFVIKFKFPAREVIHLHERADDHISVLL